MLTLSFEINLQLLIEKIDIFDDPEAPCFVVAELARLERPQMAQAAETFGSGAESFADLDRLNARLKGLVRAGVVILVKGSRAMRMERVVEALSANGGGA